MHSFIFVIVMLNAIVLVPQVRLYQYNLGPVL
jgi:hypothetical protein